MKWISGIVFLSSLVINTPTSFAKAVETDYRNELIAEVTGKATHKIICKCMCQHTNPGGTIIESEQIFDGQCTASMPGTACKTNPPENLPGILANCLQESVPVTSSNVSAIEAF